MSYNFKMIDIQYALINVFLIDAEENIVDISYSIESDEIKIQIVILEGTDIEETTIQKARENIEEFKIVIIKKIISKEKFNENRGNWQPSNYNWLSHPLFSKAEVL